MKMYLKRENKRARRLAFMLAVIMALVPFYSFSGMRKGAKAEEAKTYSFSTSTEASSSVEWKDADGFTDNTVKIVNPTTGIFEKTEYNIYIGENKAKITDKIKLSVSGSSQKTDPGADPVSVDDDTTYEIVGAKYFTIAKDVTAEAPLPATRDTVPSGAVSGTLSIDDVSDFSSPEITDTKTVALYVSFGVKKTEPGGTATETYQDYVLIGSFKVNVMSSISLTDAVWKNSSVDCDAAKSYSSALVNAIAPANWLGKFQIKVTEVQGNTETDVSNWQDLTQKVVDTDGTYKVSFRYTDSSSTVIDYEFDTDTVNIDATAPNITVDICKWTATGFVVVSTYEDGQFVYDPSGIDTSASYVVRYTVTDANKCKPQNRINENDWRKMNNSQMLEDKLTNAAETNPVYYYIPNKQDGVVGTTFDNIKNNCGSINSIIVEDEAGNEKSPIAVNSSNFKGDATAPVVSLDDITETASITPYPTEDGGSVYVYRKPKIVLNITDDINITSWKAYVKTPGETEYTPIVSKNNVNQTNVNVTLNPSNIVSGNKSGEYSVKVEAFDVVSGHKGEFEYSIMVDATAPVIDMSGDDTGLFIKHDGETEYQKYNLPDGTTEFGVNRSDSYQIRYRVVDEKISESVSGSGVKSVKENSVGVTPSLEGVYTLTLPDVSNASSYPEGTEITSKVSLEDKYTNVAERYFSFKGKVVDDVLDEPVLTVVDENGDPVEIEFDGTYKYITEPRRLEIKSYSGYKVEKISIVDNTMGADPTPVIIDNSDLTRPQITYTYDVEKGKWCSVAYYPLPKDSTRSTNLKDIRYNVTVYDATGAVLNLSDPGFADHVKNINTADYFLELTKPYVTVLNSDYDSTKWVQSYELDYMLGQKYNFSDENDNITDETNLKKGSYSITNSKTDVTDQPIYGIAGSAPIFKAGEHGAKITVPESRTAEGTKIVFDAQDIAGNTIVKSFGGQDNLNVIVVKVDAHEPSISGLKIGGCLQGEIEKPFPGMPSLTANLSDNLTIDKYTINITGEGVDKTYSKSLSLDAEGSEGIQSYIDVPLENVSEQLADGEYTVTLTVYDKSGRSKSDTISFVLDNTVPEVFIKVKDGDTANKKNIANYDSTVRDVYYRTYATVEVSYVDKYIEPEDVIVKDNGVQIPITDWSNDGANKHVGTLVVAGDGQHVVTIDAVDSAGNPAATKSTGVIVIDGVKPGIQAVLNGAIVITPSTGVVDLSGNATVAYTETDTNPDGADFNYQLIKAVPDQPVMTGSYIATDSRVFEYAEEADYTVNCYSKDMAGNVADTKTVSFRIDKTAPEISISGTSNDGKSSSATTVTFSVKELFWRDANARVSIYKKAGDGKEETLLKTIDMNLTGFETSVSEALTETGEYRFEFEARDRVGHKSFLSQKFTIDREAPVITLKGVSNFDKTEDRVEILVEIADDFYANKTVTVIGSRTDIDGKKHDIRFSGVDQTANPTKINEIFKEDGIYDIKIECRDIAGNSQSSEVHFTIDSSDPEIGDLSMYDGKTINSFNWTTDLDELVKDLTVCDVHMYLNGSEYDGKSDIEDGSYTLLIVAEDELGHKVEKEIKFVLDTKEPVFIVTGVEDGEVKNETYNIQVSLQLEEDTLKSVKLNGENIVVSNNEATFDVTEKGSYELYMEAVDEAGNTAEQTISFKYGEEKSKLWIWFTVAGAVVVLGGISFVVIKKKKK